MDGRSCTSGAIVERGAPPVDMPGCVGRIYDGGSSATSSLRKAEASRLIDVVFNEATAESRDEIVRDVEQPGVEAGAGGREVGTVVVVLLPPELGTERRGGHGDK